MRLIDRGGFGVLLLTGLLTALPAIAAQGGEEPLVVLDVPFLVQSELQCGAAATAMVLRYWGLADAHPEQFAMFVDRDAGGIRGAALIGAVRERGWFAQSLRGTVTIVRAHLARGRPLIALVEVAPGRRHYVVPVAWTDDALLVHDPADGPFRTLDPAAFLKAWAATDFWTLLILPDITPPEGPPKVRASVPATEKTPGTGTGRCADAVQRAVALAHAGDHDGAEAVLNSAQAQCPASAAVSREQAGLRFLQSHWAEAEAFASRAVSRAPADTHAWRLLASSRFMQGNRAGALDAWNHVGEPRLDRVRVDLSGADASLVRQVVDVPTGGVLTAGELRRAERRLQDLPGVAGARVGYAPRGGGAADVDVWVRARRGLLSGPAAGREIVRAAATREVRIEQSLPAGIGALGYLTVRWSALQPRTAVGLALPRAFGAVGTWQLEASWARQTYVRSLSDTTPSAEERRGVALNYADWIDADTRLMGGVALDRWSATGTYLTLSAGADHHLVGDELAVLARVAVSPGLDGAGWFGGTGGTLTWRSASRVSRPTLSVRTGFDATVGAAPIDVWPRAGAGHSEPVLMRAHPLVDNGGAGGPLLGRRLAHAGAELEVPLHLPVPLGVSAAAFADAGRAWRTLDERAVARLHVDVGVSVLLRVAPVSEVLRIDLAQGLRDGARALSVRWQVPWPGHQR
jgi:hypothetical protein